MKVLIATSLIIFTLVGVGTFNYYYFDGTAARLLTKMESIEQQVQSDNWSEADSSTDQFKGTWDQISTKWTMLIDHQELDNINISLARMEKFIETKDLPGFMAELAQLRLLIEHIPAKEALNWKNVL